MTRHPHIAVYAIHPVPQASMISFGSGLLRVEMRNVFTSESLNRFNIELRNSSTQRKSIQEVHDGSRAIQKHFEPYSYKLGYKSRWGTFSCLTSSLSLLHLQNPEPHSPTIGTLPRLFEINTMLRAQMLGDFSWWRLKPLPWIVWLTNQKNWKTFMLTEKWSTQLP